MKFEELLYQPVQAPLEGFDKAVATGFEIAQNQERLRQNQEQIGLQRQKIQDEFLTKGLSALSAMSKAKGQTRKIIGKTMFAYFERANLKLPEGTQELLLADNDYSKRMSDVLSEMKKQKIVDPQERIAFLQNVANADPDQIDIQIKAEETKLKLSQQLANQLAIESAKDVYKSAGKAEETKLELEKESRARISDVFKDSDIPPAFILKYQKRKDFDMLAATYAGQIGREAKRVRSEIKDLEGVSPSGIKIVEDTLQEAEKAYIGQDYKKGEELKNRALLQNRLLQANKKDPEKATKILESVKKVGDIFDASIGKESKTRVGYLNEIILMANDPNTRANPFSGQLALNGFAKIADPTTGVRDAEYNRIQKATGTKLETFKQIWQQMVEGRPLTEVQWANLNKVAKAVQDIEKSEYNKKFENISKVAAKSGLTDEDISIFKLRFEEPIFGVKEKDSKSKPAFLPTPTGEAPQRQSQSRGKPKIEIIQIVKKRFPNEWKQKLEQRGFDIGGL